MIVIHVTHEAVEKIGGIGAVIAGLVTSRAYSQKVSRTILLGPLFSTDKPLDRRIGTDGTVIYSSIDNIRPPEWESKFAPIEEEFGCGIVYGTRTITEPCSGLSAEVEVVLLDISQINQQRLNQFKGKLFDMFDIPSVKFEHNWEFEQYVRIAESGFECVKSLTANDNADQTVFLSHEYMGMPLVLRAVMEKSERIKTVFHAHEVAPARPVVEETSGHDTMFYNVMERSVLKGKELSDVFPAASDNFKYPLVRAAVHCDHVFAVGDYVCDELQFLDKRFEKKGINLVYNGIPSTPLTLDEKHTARMLMMQYSVAITGNLPRWVFTHVCRPVVSKSIWRDFRVLHELEPLLKERDETAIYFLLGTLGGQRTPEDVRRMEQSYGWPAQHERGYPDLAGGEELLADMIDYFNKDHSAIRAVLVNQWDWNQKFCGDRMMEEMEFADIRKGSDVEFGLSCYEPFGIAQFEPLCFGSICVPSNVCGCMGFAQKAFGGKPFDNILEGNFLKVPQDMTTWELMDLSIAQRDAIESAEGRRLAKIIFDRLPRDDKQMQRLIDDGSKLAKQMSWENVVTDYFLPALDKTIARQR